MKTANSTLIFYFIALLYLSSCSQENLIEESSNGQQVQKAVNIITSIKDMPVHIQEAIKKSKEPDSPYMQGLLRDLSLRSDASSLDDVNTTSFTFMESYESPKVVVSENTTRVEPFITVKGFHNLGSVSNTQTVKLTPYVTSPFRVSLGVDMHDIKETANYEYRVNIYFVTTYISFTEPVRFLSPKPMYNDFLGIDPATLPNPISNNSTFIKGFTITEDIPGELYIFTTYAIQLSDDKDFPWNGFVYPVDFLNSSITSRSVRFWAKHLDWTFYASK